MENLFFFSPVNQTIAEKASSGQLPGCRERGEGGGGERKKRAIKEILRSLMVFSGYTRLCGKATPPEALNLCGPGAGATENKQCLLVIRTSLRHTKSRAQIGFMFGPG